MKKTTTILMIAVLLISLTLLVVSCVFVRVQGHIDPPRPLPSTNMTK